MAGLPVARIRESVAFLVRYSLVGAIGFGANLASFTALLKLDVAVTLATGVAFLIGGQVAFICHDRFTFCKRVVDLERWQQRWRRMMAGQMLGVLVNWMMANVLVRMNGSATWQIYLVATISSAAVTCSWANYYSHKKSPDTVPAEHAKEHAHV